MRIYKDLLECVKETERNLAEMGIEVEGYSMQNKVVMGNSDFFTKEIRGEVFTITSHKNQKKAFDFIKETYNIDHLNWRWIEEEFKERISTNFTNPGMAWKLRKEVWQQFINEDSEFDYSYNERMKPQLIKIIKELRMHPNTRQAIIEIHNNELDINSLGGKKRIPCSLYYQFMLRKGKLEIVYSMRSCDFVTHFVNDIILAMKLQAYVAKLIEAEVGNFIFFCSSLHIYKKDLDKKEVF